MFTGDEKKLLEKYVTSSEANIFAVHNMSGMVGAAYARYSRAKGGFREVLLKEFIEQGNIDPQHAHELIERVLIAYGDDSVGELEPAHISFERVSMLAAKEIEDRRIGGSPIEQSTRYVLYDQKDDDGNWLYYRGDDVMKASYGKQYQETMDFIFTAYSDLIKPLKKYLTELKPIEEAEYDITGSGEKQRLSDFTDEKQLKAFKQTYNFELRAKACDILRSLLPVATLTNVGMMGNGRFFQNLLSYLLTSEIPENHSIAAGMKTALDEVIPVYIRRARRNEYQAEIHKAMYALTAEMLSGAAPEQPAELPEFILMDRGEDIIEQSIKEGMSGKEALNKAADISLLAAMLYPYARLPLVQLRQIIAGLDAAAREKIVRTYSGARKTRRDRPHRALEDGYPYTFDMITNFGVYKDLQRHRMNTQQRQLFTTGLGFYMAPELQEIGVEDKINECLAKAEALYEVMAKENPVLAQYAVLHGHYIRWTMGFNDREAMHLLELRSTPQGHPNYRQAAQKMHQLITERSKWRGELMEFVDHNEYYWSRADSEAKQRVKESKLDEKLKNNK
jgi:thymidylate synthase ThyX